MRNPWQQRRQICRELGILVVYLFGSRADDGLRLLAGETVEREGSDLDVGVVFTTPELGVWKLASVQVAPERLFAPLRVDLVPLQRVDAIFQFHAVDGHRVMATDATAADRYELVVMRRAAELVPIQRQLERAIFGISTTFHLP